MNNPKRSMCPEVRNPLLRLPAALTLLSVCHSHPEVGQEIATLLHQLGAQADEQAKQSWKRRKAPMAAYWRAVEISARHLARLLTRKGDHYGAR